MIDFLWLAACWVWTFTILSVMTVMIIAMAIETGRRNEERRQGN